MISFKLREPSGLKHPCPTHTDTESDYYCFDCSQILCHRCIVSIHCRCDKIVTLSEAVNQRKTSLKAAISKTLSQLNDREQLQDLIDKYNSRIDSHSRKVETDIKIWATDMRKLVLKLEDQLLEQLNKKCNVLKEKVESEVVQVQQVEDQVHGRIEIAYLKLLLSDADLVLDNTVDDVIKSCHLRDLSRAEENMKKKCENVSAVGIDFQELSTAHMLLRDILMTDFNDAVHLDMFSHSKGLLGQTKCDTSDHIQVLRTISAPSGSDTPAYILGLVVVGPDTIIVTDYIRNYLRKFSNRGETSLTLTLASGPSGITHVSETLAAVSLPRLGQIYLIQISPGLRVHKWIQYTQAYWALATLTSSTLVASCSKTPRVDIIDLNGQVLQSLTIGKSSYNQIKCDIPIYVCVTSDKRILVSDHRSQSLMCISQDGEILFKYTCLQCPKGVFCDSSGRIYLVNAEELISLTSDGQFHQLLVSSKSKILPSPGALAVDSKGRIYVVNKWCEVKVITII